MNADTKNAKITGVCIEYEAHGILTAWINLDYGGSGAQGFGGYSFGSKSQVPEKHGPWLGAFVAAMLQTIEVDKWEDLRGETVRVVADNGKVHRIGHALKDKWFDPGEMFLAMKGAWK